MKFFCCCCCSEEDYQILRKTDQQTDFQLPQVHFSLLPTSVANSLQNCRPDQKHTVQVNLQNVSTNQFTKLLPLIKHVG
jgi:hypothetical protein